MGVDSHLYNGKGICVYTHKMKEEDHQDFQKFLNILSDHIDDFEYIQDAYINKSFVFFPIEKVNPNDWERHSRSPAICCPTKGGAKNSEGNYSDVYSSGGYFDSIDPFAIMIEGYDLMDEMSVVIIKKFLNTQITNVEINNIEDMLDEFNLRVDLEKYNKEDILKNYIKDKFLSYFQNSNYSLPGKWLVFWSN